MAITEWDFFEDEEGSVILRRQTPVGLWLLDRWLRIPDALFDAIEAWFPATSSVTKIPCLLYARWYGVFASLVTWTEFDAVERLDPAPDSRDAA